MPMSLDPTSSVSPRHALKYQRKGQFDVHHFRQLSEFLVAAEDWAYGAWELFEAISFGGFGRTSTSQR
jgi:hypothetical protein